ncbi:MAG TPA: helix-turn-helix domain-containing protein [Candidatus Acidoferrum sp.]|nr:helix-turn-helix domain-containing protein [Candidatus Acidoferrum sp.]
MKNAKEDLKPEPPTIVTASNGNAVPLRISVRAAVGAYLDHVDATEITGFYDLVLAEVEVPLLQAVMEKVRYNQSKAARLLGLNRATLRTKLRRYHLLD